MTLPVKCSCGRTLLLKPEFAGKRVKCPLCKTSLQVPDSNIESNFEIVDDTENVESNVEVVDEALPADPPSKTAITASARRKTQGDQSEDDCPMERRPMRRRRRRSRRSADSPREDFIWKYRGAVYGGAMMLVAVLWLVVGLALGRIFFYPPVMFIVGLVWVIYVFARGGTHDRDWR